MREYIMKVKFADETNTIQWKSAAGTLYGTVERIDYDKPTADPSKNADYYLVKLSPSIARYDGESAYLNSNMMEKLNVINLTWAARSAIQAGAI